jgi:hypothetical protein
VSTRYFRIPEQMPELIPVTGLTSAVQAIETIVEEGEGARGSWQGAHFGRFLEILEAYRTMKAADPSFAPARPSVTNPYVRVPRDLLGLATASGPAAPDDPRGVHLIQDPTTAAVSDLFNACYAVMLQLLYRFFQHTEETDAELSMLGETSVLMMLQVLRPLGELLTRLPVGPRAPGWTAGPSFMLTSATPVTPHKPAAWTILGERLLELAEACDGLTADAPEVLAGVGQHLAAFAAPLLQPNTAGRRPEAGVPALTVDPPADGAPVPSFERDIRQLFTGRDRAAMRWAFDLGEVESVRRHADAILEQVTAGRMPCDTAWPPERVALFRRWVQAGSPD